MKRITRDDARKSVSWQLGLGLTALSFDSPTGGMLWWGFDWDAHL